LFGHCNCRTLANVSSCPDPEAIQSLVEESLEANARAELEDHVADCQACRQLVAALRSTMTAPTVTDGNSNPFQKVTPTAIGRYEIEDVLGAGGMGIVYAAHDPKLRRKVAIKLLRAGSGDGEDTREAQARLLREARAMAKVQHPNVVSVFDTGEHGDEVFVAMELVTGGNLRRWLTTRQRSVGEVIDVFLQAGRGLAAAHAAGLVHRDFKPDNVLVGDDRRVRVTDFGLARHAGKAPIDPSRSAAVSLRLTATGAVHGTPGYIAPEQYEHQTFDARSDQFAFCVALWEALDRRRPFRGEDHPAIEVAVVTGAISEPSEGTIPRALRRVLERGLSVDPAARWPDIDALLAAIAKTRPRSKKLPIAIGVAAAAAVIATVLVVRTRGEPPEQPDRLAEETQQISALLMSGDRAGGTARAEEVVAQYRTEAGPNYAAALGLRGFAHYLNGELAEAERVLGEAIQLAERLEEKRTKAIAIGNLVHVLEDLGKTEDAKRWSGMVVASAGAPAQTDTTLAHALDSEGNRRSRTDLAAGLAILRRGAETWAKVGDLAGWVGNRNTVAKSLINILEYDAGCAITYAALAVLDVMRPPLDDRRALAEASLANGGAICEAGRHQPAASIALSLRAIAVTEQVFGPKSIYLDTPLSYLGRAHAMAGDHAASDAAFDRLRTLPLTPRDEIRNLGIMVVTAAETQRFRVGVERAERLVKLAEIEFPENHPDRLSYQVLFAKLLVKDRQFDRAVPLLEKLEQVFASAGDPIMLADVRFALAKSVIESDAKRARTLAEQARITYRAAGTVRAPHLEDVDKFLASP
jgi:tetratricopeptide (TPR) repeat protein